MKNSRSFPLNPALILLGTALLLAACHPRQAPPPPAEAPTATNAPPTATPPQNVEDFSADLPLISQMKGFVPLTNQADIVAGVDYGRDLLHNCSLDVRYYQLAIQQLRRVLLSLGTNTTDQSYQDAWALLQVARRMQQSTYDKARFSMEQNIATMDYSTALQDAAYIYRLFPENTPQSQLAEQRFNDIKRLMNNWNP